LARQSGGKVMRRRSEPRVNIGAELVLRTYTGMTVTQCNMHAIHGFP
jgi:hypothetical protein